MGEGEWRDSYIMSPNPNLGHPWAILDTRVDRPPREGFANSIWWLCDCLLVLPSLLHLGQVVPPLSISLFRVVMEIFHPPLLDTRLEQK